MLGLGLRELKMMSRKLYVENCFNIIKTSVLVDITKSKCCFKDEMYDDKFSPPKSYKYYKEISSKPSITHGK